MLELVAQSKGTTPEVMKEMGVNPKELIELFKGIGLDIPFGKASTSEKDTFYRSREVTESVKTEKGQIFTRNVESSNSSVVCDPGETKKALQGASNRH